jgi:hypothetical protein
MVLDITGIVTSLSMGMCKRKLKIIDRVESIKVTVDIPFDDTVQKKNSLAPKK